jgi:beta-amyrin synthase
MYFQNQDGGWGLHIEGHSTMFCTALSYICMRILGEGPDCGQDNACARARKWILDHGSVTHMPSWGKTWLSVRMALLNGKNMSASCIYEASINMCMLLLL